VTSNEASSLETVSAVLPAVYSAGPVPNLRILLINPSNTTAGFALMTPRWMPVLAAATPAEGVADIRLLDQAVEDVTPAALGSADLIGISIHTLNAHRAYRLMAEIRRSSRARVVVGGTHATLFPREALDSGADAVVTGDADLVWPRVVDDMRAGRLQRVYEGGRVASDAFVAAPRWDLMRCGRYLMATVHTTKGCPESCTFCSVWRTDGRTMRQRTHADVVQEVCELRARGFRYIVLADDNFYGVGLDNRKIGDAILEERFALMTALERETPGDVVFLTQTSIRTAANPAFLDAMRRARIRVALIGIESVSPASLKQIGKTFNRVGDELVAAVGAMQQRGVYVLGSHIVGLPADTADTYREMLDVVRRSGMFLAQFVRYTLFPGTVDFERAARGKTDMILQAPRLEYWLDGVECTDLLRHPSIDSRDLDAAAAGLWTAFYSYSAILNRAFRCGLVRPDLLVGYLLLCRIFRKVYFQYGASTDSARTRRASLATRLQAEILLRLGKARSQLSRS
jgi:radical SAM superfamily enzyme YgiQ (UPF0313 family)